MKKDSKKKKQKNDFTTTLRLAVKRLAASNQNSPKNVTMNFTPQRQLAPYAVKTRCDKLANFMRQRMHHNIALQLDSVKKLITNDMSDRSKKEIVDAVSKISRDHGFDFFGN